MRLAFEALRVDLVNVLRTGGSGRKPAATCHYFQAADRTVVARCFGQLGGDGLAREIRLLYGFRREFLQFGLLLGSGRRVNARVVGGAELRRQFAIVLSGV